MKTNAKKPSRFRVLRHETLESRELLAAVNADDFAAIKAQYAELGLTNYNDYNVITIEGTQLNNDTALRNAIAAAATTVNDLIVVRTTASQNKITLGGTVLPIVINTSHQYGSVAIVSFGTTNLTIDQ
ncbi:MAG: hypothetical protein FWE67_12820 [Planctomycetaceae bacterium]|nr:hypothetical protein [Planctomycetaceae bacterium]